tara:strand:+ start:327 stop:1067 length:741 start_codon:yes stop_codon:yes gene_type:complete
MSKGKKSRRRRKQRGGGGPNDDSTKPLLPQRTYANVVPSKSTGGLKEPLINKNKSSSKNLKNIYEKSKNILQGFTFKDMFLWVLIVVAIVIYSISITNGSPDKENHMLVITYSILLVCSLFIGISYYFSKKGGSDDVTGSINNIFKTMIPLLSSISGLIYIIMTYSSNLETISSIGKHVEELSTFNNFIAVMSFFQVSRLIIYFKRMGTKQAQNMFDYVIFTICFITQIALTVMISNKLESYRTDG